MHDCWEQMVDGVLVEVPNTDLEIGKDIRVYWIATVLKICGKYLSSSIICCLNFLYLKVKHNHPNATIHRVLK